MAKGLKTGGRRPGTKNKAAAAREAAVAASGLTPLDYMLGRLRDENASDEDRKWAAQNAAPYIHPKLSSVDNTLKGDGAINIVVKRYSDEA